MGHLLVIQIRSSWILGKFCAILCLPRRGTFASRQLSVNWRVLQSHRLVNYLYVSIDWQSFWGVNQSTIYFLCIGADEVGNWAGSGEILAAAHLFQLRIGVFQTHLDGAVGWSWYPSHLHYPDSPVVLLYNITADHFTLIERVSPAIVIS